MEKHYAILVDRGLKMKTETKFIIDYFRGYLEFLDYIKTETKIEKILHMKKNIKLDIDTELSPVQCNLFYAAISNIEWDIVIKEIEAIK